MAASVAEWDNMRHLDWDLDFLKSLFAHDNYKSVPQNHMELGKSISSPDAYFKKKSKGGLPWICRHTDFHIHFCLDGIEMLKVPSKNYDGPGTKDYPAARREARNAPERCDRSPGPIAAGHRNRRDTRVQNQVQFWLNNNQIEPPWVAPPHPVEWQVAWASYIPRKEHEKTDTDI